MKGKLILAAMLGVSLAIGSQLMSADEDSKFKLTCPVSGKPAKKSAAVELDSGAKVYFCCENCPNAFKKNPDKFAAKANHQLYGTGQAKLAACPLTGKKLNPATAIEIEGVKVCFCCNGCKGKATKASGKAQLELVFGKKAFAKGFKIKKSDE